MHSPPRSRKKIPSSIYFVLVLIIVHLHDLHRGRCADPVSTGFYHLHALFVISDAAGGLDADMIAYCLSHESHVFFCSSALIESCGGLDELSSCFHGKLAGFHDLGLGEKAGLQDNLDDSSEGSGTVNYCSDVVSDVVIVS